MPSRYEKTLSEDQIAIINLERAAAIAAVVNNHPLREDLESQIHPLLKKMTLETLAECYEILGKGIEI